MTALYVDRTGDVWREFGHTADGDVLLACDFPQSPDDRGDGESYPWTLRTVEARFGPVVAASPDAEMTRLALVDVALHARFGRNESAWTARQTAAYLAEVDGVHAVFHPERRAAA